jgi:hypothetical protein
MDSAEAECSRSCRHRCRKHLGDFFHLLLAAKPRWVSMLHPVNGDPKSCLTHLLGFEHIAGLQFLVLTGLISRSPKSDTFSVVPNEWEKFVIEQNLQSSMEITPTITTVGRRHYFIHYGQKGKLNHIPMDQFKGKIEPAPISSISSKQKKLHKQISNVLLSMARGKKEALEDPVPDVSCDAVTREGENEYEEEEMVVEDVASDAVPNALSEAIPGGWSEEYTQLNEVKAPNLSRLFGGKKYIPTNLVTAIFRELLSILGDSNNVVTFHHRNGQKGVAVMVPVVKSQESFLEQARKKKWVEKMLAHMCGSSEADIDDAAQWLTYYLGKRHDASFTLACDSLGIPLVEQMDDAGAEAMWAQANVNITQQRIIKRHLRHHFGKRVFIPEKKLSFDSEYYKVPIFFGEYKYYKDNDTSQKAEKCNYWCRDCTLVVSKELERLVDYTNDLDVINRFSSISSATNGGMNIVAGADQGQGAWRSWIKITTMSASEIRERMGKDEDFDPKNSYIITQVAHINCKKDHHTILKNTVSEHLSTGYEKLRASALVIIRCSSKQKDSSEAKVKSVFVSKYATDIKIENDLLQNGTCTLTYVLQSEHFSTKCVHEERFPANATILFIIPKFNLFLTGDLSYYADILGMPNSCSHWCPFCLLSRPEWQESASNTGDARTAAFLQETYEKIKNNASNKLTPYEKKGISCAVHYSCLTPEDLVPPLLHMEIGMVNQVWDNFKEWIDDSVERIPVDEKVARESMSEAKRYLDAVTSEKEDAKNTISIDVREKNAAIKKLKDDLKKARGNAMESQGIQARLTLMESLVKEQNKVEETVKKKFKDAQA